MNNVTKQPVGTNRFTAVNTIDKLTDDQFNIIEESAKSGLTQQYIADRLGVSRVTFQNWLAQGREELKCGESNSNYARIALLYARARGDLFNTLGSKLYSIAVDPPKGTSNAQVRALEFILKTQAGWSETQKIEHSGGEKPILVANATVKQAFEEAIEIEGDVDE